MHCIYWSFPVRTGYCWEHYAICNFSVYINLYTSESLRSILLAQDYLRERIYNKNIKGVCFVFLGFPLSKV